MRQMRREIIGMALGAMLLTYGATSASAQSPQTTEVREVPSQPNRVLTGGLTTFALSYGAALIVAATSSHAGDNRLFVPLLGPWLDLGARGGCPIGNQSCDRETTYKILLVTDGVFQAAGILAIASGLLSSDERTASTTKVRVVPVSLAYGSPGLAAFGRF